MEESIKELKNYFEKQEEVRVVYVFGSTLQDRKVKGDVDIAVFIEPEKKEDFLRIQMRLIGELTVLLKRNDVDVVILNEATPLLGYEIVTKGKVILDKDRLKDSLFSQYISKYLDFKPVLEFHRERISQYFASYGKE